MNREAWIILIANLTTDVFFVCFSFVLAYIIRFNMFEIEYAALIHHSRFLFFIAILWLIIFNTLGLYKPQAYRYNFVAISAAATLAAAVTYLVIFLFYREAIFSSSIIFYAWLIGLVLLNFSRFVIWKIRSGFRV